MQSQRGISWKQLSVRGFFATYDINVDAFARSNSANYGLVNHEFYGLSGGIWRKILVVWTSQAVREIWLEGIWWKGQRVTQQGG